MSNETDGLTRRDFLKGSVVTAAAIGLGTVGVFTHAQAEMIGPNDTINAAIIGIGSQGSILLERAIKAPNVKFVACCDIQPRNLKHALDIAKGAEGYSDYRQVLDRKDIQAIVIAVPIGLHAQIAIDSLRAGKNVFSEKMMAYSIEDAKHMARVARQTGKKLQIGHQRRNNPNYQHAHNMIQDGLIGKITHVRAQWNRNASWRRPVPKDGTEELTNWRLYRKSSQGLMAELGSHQIDVVNWMVGEVPSSVVGIGGLDFWKDGRDINDNVQLVFEYPGGIKFTYQSLTTNQFDGATEEIMGTKGTMVLSEGPCSFYHEPKTDEQVWESMAHKDTSGGKTGIVLDASKSPRLTKEAAKGSAITGADNLKKDAYLLELEDFFMTIRDGHDPKCTPKVGLETCVAAIKGNEAMDTKKWVEIPAETYQI
jgi:predicted dehydrogenase